MSDTPYIPRTRPQMLSQDEIDALAKAFDKHNAARVNINQGFNGSTKFVNWMLGIVAALVIAGITGEILTYGQVQAIAAKVDVLMMERHR